MADIKHFDEAQALRRAMDLFWRRGYDATSLQDLVDELGISRSSLYSTFGGKDDLFQAALQHYCRVEAGPRHELLQRPGPVLDAIRELLSGIAAAPTMHPDRRGCLVVNAAMERVPGDPETAAAVATQLRRFENALADAVRRGQRDGELDPGQDPRSVARYLVTLVQGMRVVGKAAADPAMLQDVVEVALGAIHRVP